MAADITQERSRVGQGRRAFPALSKRWNVILLVFSALFVGIQYWSYAMYNPEPKGCEMVWMYPNYASLSGLNPSRSRLAEKYSVHFYREGNGLDENNLEPSGVPVLFIPGNAGSYKQGRSIASYCARRSHGVLEDGEGPESLHFDFYLVDFHEDLTAFHGRTLLDQAEYVNDAIKAILSLYDDATSIIVIGHSMGGIVARTLITLPNYNPESVNTIITLSSPHVLPPLTFDRDINTVYDRVNSYWRTSFASSSGPLQDMVLVSITGGGLDTLVPADYTSVSSIVPDTQGFSTFSLSIPNVWTSIDHQAMVWCGQCRRAVANSLFDLIRPGSKTVLLVKDRLKALKHHLLPSLDLGTTLDEDSGEASIIVDEDASIQTGSIKASSVHSSPLIYDMKKTGGAFVRTTCPNCNVHLCRDADTDAGKDSVLDHSTTDSTITMRCRDVSKEGTVIPESTSKSVYAHESKVNSYLWAFDSNSSHGYDKLLISSPNKERVENALLVANDSPIQKFKVDDSLLSLLVFGTRFNVKASGLVDVSLSSATTSLASFTVRVTSKEDDRKEEWFSPILRQYVPHYQESRYHVNVLDRSTIVSFHGRSPYVPYDPQDESNLHLQLLTEPSDEVFDISISLNVLGTLGNLAMRYRVLAATLPLAVSLIVFMFQLIDYRKTGEFYSFGRGLAVLSRMLPKICVFLSLLHFALSYQPILDLLRRFQFPSEASNIAALHAFDPDLVQNDIYMGLSDWRFFFLCPLFVTAAVGMCAGVHFVVELFVGAIVKLVPSRPRARSQAAADSGVGYGSSVRLITVAALCILVSIVVPYQFAMVVGAVLQLVRTAVVAVKSPLRHSFYNFNGTITILLILGAIVNSPITVVWIRNLNFHSTIWFSSHHNLLAVLPILLLVENLYAGNMLPVMNSLQIRATMALLIYGAMYCLLYGLWHTFMLHHIVNVLAGWLLIVYLDDPGTRSRFTGSKKD